MKQRFALIVPVLVLSACAAENNEVPIPEAARESSQLDALALQAPQSDVEPVARLPLKNGNVLEFYEFQRGAILSEVGRAYSDQLFDGRGKDARDLVETWRSLRPDLDVPPALIRLQERLTTPSESHATIMSASDSGRGGQRAPERASTTEGRAGGSRPATGDVTAMSGCGNGCCDYSWLSQQYECYAQSDAEWFLFQYGYSIINYNQIQIYKGMVCAATGTSTYSIQMSNGTGGTWSVLQGWYRTYSWYAAYDWAWCWGPCGENMTSSVNNSWTWRDHTYCGFVTYD